ncbi:MAG: hypothetical protein JOZ18_07940, partial [Chloroflexi bacterium]|nr:hypothetical protein [Chloroflexota bacterium]
MREGSIFLPQGAVTGIGSLPLTNAQTAVTFVAQMCPEVPFWPQLPRRSVDEQMIEQALGAKREFFVRRKGTYGYQVKPGLLRTCLEAFSTGTAQLHEQCASGFVAFEQACASHTFTQAQALKGQLIGPITLACSLFSEERAFLFDQDCLEAVSRWVTRLALWQAHRLQQWKLPVICFLDEPCLALLTREPFQQRAGFAILALQTVITTLQAAGILVGLHCCADQTSFSIMCQAAPDILSFDAYQNLELFERDQDARAFLKGGGLVAFGLIPTIS